MAYQGLIRGFGTYNVRQLEQMKEDLKIAMPLKKLAFCASYYRMHAKRDPFIEELQFLDLFCKEETPSPLSVAPIDLATNDAFVAETYADMMKKRAELSPDAKLPCTLSEALGLAGSYLGRAGKRVSLAQESYFLEDVKKNPGIVKEDDILSVQGSRFALRCMYRKQQLLQNDDLLVLLLPMQQLSYMGHSAAVNAFLGNEKNAAMIKQLRAVEQTGVLYEILRMTDGVNIELSRFSRTGEELPLSALVEAHTNGHLLRITRSDYEPLAESAQKNGLRALAFAKLTAGRLVKITRKNGTEITLDTLFLRSLFDLHTVSVQMKDEKDGALAPICHVPFQAEHCSYLYSAESANTSTLSAYRKCVYTASFAAPQGAFFRNALDTALCSVLSLCAAGIPYSQQRLAVSLNLPAEITDSQNASAAMSVILGLYRLETELGVPLSVGKLTTEASCRVPEITVYGMANGQKKPSSFTAPDHNVYCIAPPVTKDGIPNFERLRSFLQYITQLAQKGTLKSARVICRETIAEGINRMSDNGITCQLLPGAFFDAEQHPMAILLESDEQLEATKIGVTVPVEASQNPLPTELRFPKTTCMIWSPNPRAVIFAESRDNNAQALAAILTQKGAEVKLLWEEDGVADPLAAALLCTQTLIVCGKVKLPNTERVRFSLETLDRANGRLVFVGGAEKPSFVRGFCLEHGISAQMLEQICKKNEET